MVFSSIRRGYQIIRAILQHGLDELVWSKLPISIRIVRQLFFWLRNRHADKHPAERLRLTLETLGPIHIKLGQMLSTRKDLLDEQWAYELSKLQDDVPPFSGEQAIAEIESELGCSIDQYFYDFNSTPLASASIAQVHTAKLKQNDSEVVLKVLRPEIEKQIYADLDLLLLSTSLIDKWVRQAKRLRLKEVIEDYQSTLLKELNLTLEAENATIIKNNFKDSNALYVPKVYDELCHSRLMVMERIYGIPVADIAALKEQGTDLKLLAERGVEVFFTQVFRDNFFHADMHPGNIFVAYEKPEDPHYIGIDYGIVGQLDEQDKRLIADVFLAFFNHNYSKLAHLFIEQGWVSDNTDKMAFERAVTRICQPLADKPLAEISFGQVLLELFSVARDFELIVQPQLILLQKTLLYVEGLGRQLYPQLDLWQTAKPFLESWLQSQIGVKAQYQKVKQQLPSWLEHLPQLPELLVDNLKMGRGLLQSQQQMLNQFLSFQRKKITSNYYFFSGLVGFLTIPLLHPYQLPEWANIALGVIATALWIKGWLSRPEKDKL
ncbi:ubiquinone biosynthesis regulatory protein kinase UbiB [Paraferrimonas sp. SM1919]|uniref:ubiquinone biosynthesis regulatory protein kinase UbiB n=1 Tax=Paraferrimonas sp. SM1919 TaxID=2662263 RepID=UPI0013D61979|nr:ubiquinone biosynthesis regulatory protein kinase UbiB [Paraferrimonas sp. SM1919]